MNLAQMNSREKYSLQSMQELILRDVRACDVQDYLFETSVLSLDDLNSLEEEKNPKRRIEMVLQWVEERPATFQHFSDSLRERHPYIVQEMAKVLASASDCSSNDHQSAPPPKNYIIEGDGNFVVADSENTRVHMKRSGVPAGPEPS